MPIFYSPVPDDISTGLAYVGTSVLSDHVRSERCDLSPSRAVANEVSCNLPLQMLIYFNLFYLPLWCLSSVCMLEIKFVYLPGYYQGLLITGIVLVTILELLRLYLGYFGNLEENVPALSCFCVLTFAFQLPILLFFVTDEGLAILPLERAVHILFLAFALAENLAAGLALRTLTRKLTLLFHLRQMAKVESSGHAGAPVLGLAYRRAVTPVAHLACR
ncbi:transmembrane protein 17A isoform X3 [Corythoichthys intestinalis]|uniref:transmembrane protein 17A isoform X3 n=1 Tax=Corythoichthys intestinalis TaxID=161448 RepID=UPI0025A588C3|nr:transmembrane protein 17A isoform X3 [Corythoichthys intestinalis]XP_061811421.1 transmembrane protein 17A-like [Nerophis lumbriciformis]